MGGQGRKTIITYNSPKRYRRGQEPDFPTEERLSFVQPLSLTSFASSPSRGASGETVHFAGPAKASPFGRGVTEGDGEGKPGRKEPLRSDRQALCQSDTIAVSEQFGSGLALSVSSPCSSPAPPKGEPLACRSGSPSYNLSVSLRSTAPLVGEPLAKPFTLRGLPRPPLGRGGGSASALTERLSSSPSGGAVTPAA